jgi:hypothetical protein
VQRSSVVTCTGSQCSVLHLTSPFCHGGGLCAGDASTLPSRGSEAQHLTEAGQSSRAPDRGLPCSSSPQNSTGYGMEPGAWQALYYWATRPAPSHSFFFSFFWRYWGLNSVPTP